MELEIWYASWKVFILSFTSCRAEIEGEMALKIPSLETGLCMLFDSLERISKLMRQAPLKKHFI